MAEPLSWLTSFDAELRRADAARAAGNEGKARVCARRAAGIVINEYLHQRESGYKLGSAYARLKYLVEKPDLSPELRQVAGHFLLHVSVERNLPVEADLIAEARWLASQLLPQ
jgi:hypothetical protein